MVWIYPIGFGYKLKINFVRTFKLPRIRNLKYKKSGLFQVKNSYCLKYYMKGEREQFALGSRTRNRPENVDRCNEPRFK